MDMKLHLFYLDLVLYTRLLCVSHHDDLMITAYHRTEKKTLEVRSTIIPE